MIWNVDVAVVPTVTVSGAVPLSTTKKVFASVAAVLRKTISLKARLAGVIFI
jgi:hypothetical protein